MIDLEYYIRRILAEGPKWLPGPLAQAGPNRLQVGVVQRSQLDLAPARVKGLAQPDGREGSVAAD